VQTAVVVMIAKRENVVVVVAVTDVVAIQITVAKSDKIIFKCWQLEPLKN